MTPTAPQNVSINAQGNVTFACPECGDMRTASVMSYCDVHAPVGVECDCGIYFDIVINTRSHYRQDVNLSGMYTPLGSSEAFRMTVKNLSTSGVCFRMTQPYRLQIDDKIELSFQLDDADQTLFNTLAIIRWVQDRLVGAEFDQPSVDQSILSRVLPS